MIHIMALFYWIWLNLWHLTIIYIIWKLACSSRKKTTDPLGSQLYISIFLVEIPLELLSQVLKQSHKTSFFFSHVSLSLSLSLFSGFGRCLSTKHFNCSQSKAAGKLEDLSLQPTWRVWCAISLCPSLSKKIFWLGQQQYWH